MRRLLVPFLTYIASGALYLILGEAPLRVRVLSLAIFAIALLVPSLWAAHLLSQGSR